MAKKIDITRYEVKNSKIPHEFDGFKIAQISDLHNEIFGANNELLIKKIDEIKPDIVVLTGDLIIGSGEDYQDNLKFLRTISKKYKTYSVMGNHEQEALTGEHIDHYKNYFKELEKLNITDLNNSHTKLFKGKSSINLHGLLIPLDYYPYGFHTKKTRKDNLDSDFLDDVLGSANENEYNIMLAHNPLFFEDYSTCNIDLIFSGHVHGGMIRIPGIGGLLSPTRRFFPKYDWGKYELNNTTMILSKGLGGAGFIPRIFCNPEIMCVTLKCD